MSERLGFQIGAVFINAFNRTEREFLTTDIRSPGFGTLFANGDGRRMQLEGRLEW